MERKRKPKERIQTYPDLFGGIEPFGGSLSATKSARRSPNAHKAGYCKGMRQSSREKRNMRLWSSLYPTPPKAEKGAREEYMELI